MHYVVNFLAVIGFLAIVFIGWAIWDDYYAMTAVVRDSKKRRATYLKAQTYPGCTPVVSYIANNIAADRSNPYWQEEEPVDHFGEGGYAPGRDLNLVDAKRHVCMTNWNERINPEEYREPYSRLE